MKGRTTWYETVEEMQTGLEAYLETYNRKRPHRGRAMEGRTPYQVFKTGLPTAGKVAKAKKEDANRKAAQARLRRGPSVGSLPSLYIRGSAVLLALRTGHHNFVPILWQIPSGVT